MDTNLKKIILVEPCESIKMMVFAILKSNLPFPCELAWFNNGSQFLSAVRLGIKVDLLITDVVLPGKCLPEFIREFVTRYPEVPVMVFTGNYKPDQMTDRENYSQMFKSLPYNYPEQYGIKRYKMHPKPFKPESFLNDVLYLLKSEPKI